jgi:hypothetical protein
VSRSRRRCSAPLHVNPRSVTADAVGHGIRGLTPWRVALGLRAHSWWHLAAHDVMSLTPWARGTRCIFLLNLCQIIYFCKIVIN